MHPEVTRPEAVGRPRSEDGHRLWQRCDPTTDASTREQYCASIRSFRPEGTCRVDAVAREELPDSVCPTSYRLLLIQEKEARWWRDACVLYFQTFAKLALPAGSEKPEHSLERDRKIQHLYVPGTPTPS